MANTKSAKKRARQTIKRTARNYKVRSQIKTAVKSAREAIEKKGKDVAATVVEAVSVLAKARRKGVLHKKALARKTSRLMKQAAKTVKSATK